MFASRVRIRSAKPADLDCLVSLLAALFAIEQDFVFDEPRQRRGLMLMLENERGCVLVAEAEGRVVGMCTGQVTISTAEGGHALLIEDVIVSEQWRGKGVGRYLLESLEVWAREQGLKRLQLLADHNNISALDFYEALGWQATALVCLRKALAPE
ncbi:MAG: GNAT family N-acetyltransferase [Deltaproteobacteria bacterium RIFOXYD12_FULL_55_16]|nr:MAG: GNAT family N-acetyltransferase [Deltaproteobacteria bacterium RIFOXYD12_FULL_55_16]